MPLRVTLTTPERLIFEGLPAEAVVAPAADGELGILPGHTALIALLGTGELRVTSAGKVRRYAVDGGFLEVVRDTVTLLAERALAAGESEPEGAAAASAAPTGGAAASAPTAAATSAASLSPGREGLPAAQGSPSPPPSPQGEREQAREAAARERAWVKAKQRLGENA